MLLTAARFQQQTTPNRARASSQLHGLDSHAALGAVAGPMCYAGGAQAPAYPLRMACSSGRLLPLALQPQPLLLPEGLLLTNI